MSARPELVEQAPLKACKVCRGYFPAFSTLAQTCNDPVCKREWRRQRELKKAAMVARRERRERLAQMKTIPKLISEAQHEFNVFIRERDHASPCISCGIVDPPERFGGAWDCGHFRTVAAAGHLRFDERNAHKQCKSCNGGRANFTAKAETVRRDYKARLIEKLGVAEVEALENDNRTVKWTRDELVAIRREYLGKWKALRAKREAR